MRLEQTGVDSMQLPLIDGLLQSGLSFAQKKTFGLVTSGKR
jgi:hypothetical protein